MEQLKCLGCENMVDQTPKKRPKLYCSDKCRQKVWQENRRQELAQLKANSIPLPDGYVEIKNIKAVTKERKIVPIIPPKASKHSSEGVFMGHPIPKGLKGIELSIWKAEIKENGIHKG